MSRQAIILIYKSTCTRCKTARTYLRNLGARYEGRNILRSPLSQNEIRRLVGRDKVDRYFNKRNPRYRKSRIRALRPSKRESIRLLARDLDLLRRPILIRGVRKVVGFDPGEFRKLVHAR